MHADAAPSAHPSRPTRRQQAGRQSAEVRPGRVLRAVLVLVWLAVAVGAALYGGAYYRTPLTERPFTELHAVLAPTGVVGHSLGILGSLMMIVGVVMYAVRKRLALLQNLGRLSTWLDVHIFLCTLGPFLVLLHTSFKFGGIVSIAFWSMTAVVASGVFGRFVYVRIPKGINGAFLTLRQLEGRRAELVEAVAASGGNAAVARLPGRPRTAPGGFAALGQALAAAVRGDGRTRAVRRRLQRAGVPAPLRAQLAHLIAEQVRLEQQIAWLRPFQRLFRYWHIFHLPLALLMFVILAVHVAVAAMFGYAWPF